MADMMFQPWLLLCLFSMFLIPVTCQDNLLPQNIQTFYPFEFPPSAPKPNPPISPQLSLPPEPPSPPPPQPQPPPPPRSSSKRSTVVKAVAATAASTLVVAGLLFFLLQKCCVAAQRRRQKGSTATATASLGSRPVVVSHNEFSRFDGNLKGLIVDENGLDVLYWRKLQGSNQKNSFHKDQVIKISNNEEQGEKGKRKSLRDQQMKSDQHIQEIPLLRVQSSTSYNKVQPVMEDLNPQPVGISLKAVEKPEPSIRPSAPPPPPSLAIPNNKNPAPPPPPLLPVKKKSPAPPPPPPLKAGGVLTSSLKPPPVPKGLPGNSEAGESSSNAQVKLKPLHWDKVNINAEHSMVWNKIDGGSFRFDDDLMEALFGSVATNRKSPQKSKPSSPNSGPAAQITILDARKSQNSAIVLKSLVISRKEILDALVEGKGLNADTLEKLTRIAPTKEEQSQILEFSGDPTRLADAESFLYHLLKAIPTAFARFNAMLFRSNYGSEVLQLKESVQTLELGCKELRTRGLFMKLLEAILKAGNRMNAGTARGNALAFNLTALRKLSDVKSIDGKTTLLHFVVEEVVRSEGKRCLINRNRSLIRTSSQSSNSGSSSSDNLTSKEEREKEYIMLGLPVVGGLSAEFSSVKKAATMDYNTLAATCPALTAHAADIQQLISQCATDGGGGEQFAREIGGFLEATEEELKVVREEQIRVMELVKRTTEYYHTGASKDKGANPLQLFVIVKDFLGTVDQVCVEIARNLQRKKAVKTSFGSSSPTSPASRNSVRFPILPAHFMSDKSNSSSNESDKDI